MSQFALLNACPFRPEDIKPGDFDFQAHLPVGKKTKKEKAKGRKGKRSREDSESEEHPSHDAGASNNTALPKRLCVSAFSKKVGHRAMGLQVSQVKLFIERFPTEFRMMALGKVVLPVKDGKPYVTEDGLPCPLLSTFNALRYLSTRFDDEGTRWNAGGKSQLRRVIEEGVQVEWMECDSFLSWQVMCDQADAQTQVQVHPHILDTAMKYVHYLRASFPSPDAGEAEDAISLAGKKRGQRFPKHVPGQRHPSIPRGQAVVADL